MTPGVKTFLKKFCKGPNTCLVLNEDVLLTMDLNISTKLVLFIFRTWICIKLTVGHNMHLTWQSQVSPSIIKLISHTDFGNGLCLTDLHYQAR